MYDGIVQDLIDEFKKFVNMNEDIMPGNADAEVERPSERDRRRRTTTNETAAAKRKRRPAEREPVPLPTRPQKVRSILSHF